VGTLFGAGWKARYIGASSDVPGNAINGGKLAAMFYQDLHMDWSPGARAVQLQLGVDNLFDRQPPPSAANNPINVDIYTYDLRGRYFYARLTHTF
jgi:iron complex outermembrane receptor protein